MPKFIDISGQKYGRLTALYRLHNYHKNGTYWLCVCDCGNLSEVNIKDLRKGNTKSCGCLRGNHCSKIHLSRGKPSKHGYKHKNDNPRIYRIYRNMLSRCYYHKCDRYKNYGGRGIKMCDEWYNDFQNFNIWAMNNGYNDTLTIDRIDVNKNYSPDNCRWVTLKQQCRNTTKNVYLTYNGKRQIMKDWATELNIPYHRIVLRHSRGWSDKECLFGKD